LGETKKTPGLNLAERRKGKGAAMKRTSGHETTRLKRACESGEGQKSSNHEKKKKKKQVGSKAPSGKQSHVVLGQLKKIARKKKKLPTLTAKQGKRLRTHARQPREKFFGSVFWGKGYGPGEPCPTLKGNQKPFWDGKREKGGKRRPSP